MTDTEIWERACQRAGIWRGWTKGRNADEIRHTYPPLGSPDAVVKMLEWLAAEIDVPMRDDETGEIVQVPDRRGLPELWFGDDYFWHCRAYGYADVSRHPQLELAIAAAVCALPEEKL